MRPRGWGKWTGSTLGPVPSHQDFVSDDRTDLPGSKTPPTTTGDGSGYRRVHQRGSGSIRYEGRPTPAPDDESGYDASLNCSRGSASST